MDREELFSGKQYLSLHLVESLAAALPVRDENGQPKMITYGGVPRTLVTSAARRRAERMYSRDRANQGEGPLADYSVGVRTREWADLTARALVSSHGWEYEDALEAARTVLMGVGLKFGDKARTEYLTKVLIFAPQDAGEVIAKVIDQDADELSGWIAAHRAVRRAAQAAVEQKKAAKRKKEEAPVEEPVMEEGSTALPPMPKSAKEGVLKALAPRDAIDIALYGRFLAEITQSPDVDGAVQTAHAFSTHEAQHYDDFYSAADDAKMDRRRSAMQSLDDAERPSDDAGSAMTGYQALVSGTFYRHAALDRFRLRANLLSAGFSPDEVMKVSADAEGEFIDAFVHAFPRAKQTSTASTGTLPKVVFSFSGNRPYNYAGVFEKPVTESVACVRRLVAHHRMVQSRREDIGDARFLTYDLDVQEVLQGFADQGVLPGSEVTGVRGLFGV